MNQWINGSMDQWINESIHQWINGSMNQWISESINQSINQSISQPVCLSVCLSVSQSIKYWSNSQWNGQTLIQGLGWFGKQFYNIKTQFWVAFMNIAEKYIWLVNGNQHYTCWVFITSNFSPNNISNFFWRLKNPQEINCQQNRKSCSSLFTSSKSNKTYLSTDFVFKD